MFSGEFEKKVSVSSILDAKIQDQQLSFDFLTPLNAKVARKTTAKAVLRDGQLLVVWVSALEQYWVPQSETLFNSIRDSFRLT